MMSDCWQVEKLYHAAREDRAVLDQADPVLARRGGVYRAKDTRLNREVLRYGCPEQARGELVDKRSDSLGLRCGAKAARAKSTEPPAALRREVAIKNLVLEIERTICGE
jgi:hypothetical protein